MMLVDISFNDINVNIANDSITMYINDFDLLLNKIHQMQKQVEKQIEELSMDKKGKLH